MAVRRTSAAWAALTAVVLVVGGVVAPAMADDPPPAWVALPDYPVPVGDLSVGFETTTYAENPWGIGASPAPPVPYIRPTVVNNSDDTRYFGFGMDMDEEGVVERLWNPEPWGEIYVMVPEIITAMTATLGPGESFADLADFAGLLNTGVPRWSGRTFSIFELSGPPELDPVGTEIATFTEPGQFIPAHLDEITEQDFPAVGQPLEVSGTGAESDIFPGVTASVEASLLVPGETLELWLIPNYEYWVLLLIGGALPDSAIYLGEDTVADDGTFSSLFEVPANTPIGDRYQLVAGVPAERYWPAGTHRYFSITEPDDWDTQPTPTDGTPLTIPFELTAVTFTFPPDTGEGETTAAVTATGPESDEFIFASDPPLYYHLDTTSTFTGDIEVCITYSPLAIPGDPPYLYHYEQQPPPGGHRWVDITTTREIGTVCGETSSFSAFALGNPLHDGSTVAPAKGVLSSDNGQDTGLHDGTYAITMDLWWGENAGTVRLLEGGAVVSEQALTRNTPNPQRAVFPITGKSNGTYVYTAELVNSTGVTTTRSLTVKVTDANPGKLSLSATSPKNGAFTLTADMWWGTNATSAQFYQGGVPVGGPITLTAQTPNPQSASLSLVRPKGDYVYKVAFTNAAGTTWSADLKVKVK